MNKEPIILLSVGGFFQCFGREIVEIQRLIEMPPRKHDSLSAATCFQRTAC